MLAGNAFEALNALKFALERTLVIEGPAPDDLSRSKDTCGIAAGQPNLAVRPPANAPQQLVIGHSVPDRQK